MRNEQGKQGDKKGRKRDEKVKRTKKAIKAADPLTLQMGLGRQRNDHDPYL
jgi:hypothetical protein